MDCADADAAFADEDFNLGDCEVAVTSYSMHFSTISFAHPN